VDHLPGEDHTIEKPREYEKWRAGFRGFVGMAESHGDELQLRMRRLFAPQPSDQYASSIWNFRRVFCAGNFQAGAFPSDITMLMTGNEYHGGPIIEVSPGEASRHREAAKQLTLSLVYFSQTELDPAYPGIRPRGDVLGSEDGLAQYPYIRESRRIKAEFTVLEQHFRVDLHPDGPVLYKDSVGVGGYRMDIHERGTGATSRTWELHGKHWVQQIPLGALIPVRAENLLPAAKNIGTTHVTNGAFRLHPVEWNIGEAAGALAAHCLDRKLSPREVRGKASHLEDFQRTLMKMGIELRWSRLEVARSYNSHYAEVPGWYFGEAERKYGK